MPRRRPPDWRRGQPKYPENTSPTQEKISDTRAFDPSASRTVEGTLNTEPLNLSDFQSIQSSGQLRRFRLDLKTGGAIAAIALPLIAALVYVVRLEGQIAVVNSEIRATQKTQDTWINEFREQVRKVERSIESLWARQPAPSSAQKTERTAEPTETPTPARSR